MKRIICASLIGITGLSVLMARSHADEKPAGPNVVKTEIKPDEKKSSSFQTAALAAQLAAWARTNHDPLEMASAAQLLASDPPREMPAGKKVSEGNKSDRQEPASPAFTVDGLLGEARELAGDDKEQLTLIATIERLMPKDRGHPGGAVVDHDVLLPDGGKMTYTLTFEKGQPMEIAIFASGSDAVDWHVFDENNNEIDSQASGHFLCTPKWRGAFKIVLTNKTSEYLPYTMATN